MALTHNERKGLLFAKGRRIRAIAEELGVSPGLVSGVLAQNYGHRTELVELVEAYVCTLLEKSHDEVFGPVAVPSGAPLGDTLLAAGAAE